MVAKVRNGAIASQVKIWAKWGVEVDHFTLNPGSVTPLPH